MPRPNRAPRRDIDAEIAAARELLNGIYLAIREATPKRQRAGYPEPVKLRVLRERQQNMSEILKELVEMKDRMERADG